MSNQVGILLWEMRTVAGWSLGKLAQQAGVSKMALSRWESGARQPRIPELEAVLTALNASAAQRAAVLGCIQTPRAVQRLRSMTLETGLAEMPTVGDLLRALRCRKGLTQEQTAQAIGVTQGTIARWEKGERLPDTTQMHTLCYLLGAQEDELLALTTGNFAEEEEQEPKNWHEAQEQIQAALKAALCQPQHIPSDLFYLSWERKALHWAIQEEKARPILGVIYGWHAQSLRNQRRYAELVPLAKNALEFSSPDNKPAWQRAIILSGSSAVFGGNHMVPERGIRLLRRALDYDLTPAYRGWMLSDIASYMQMAGKREQSLVFLAEACRVAEHDDNILEGALRRHDLALALLKLERPCDALRVLPEPIEGFPRENAEILMLWSEAHRRAGNLSEAHDALQQAHNLIAKHNIVEFRPQVASLL